MMFFVKRYLAPFALLLVFTSNASVARVEIPRPSPIIELPIRLVDNRVQLTLPVNDYLLRFALDTGASRTVIFQSENHDFADLPSLSEVRVAFPALDEFVSGTHLAPISIMFGDHVFVPDKPILIKQRPPIGKRLSFKFNGILGQDFFKTYVVEIDPKEKLIRLYKRGTHLKRYFRTHIKLYMKGSSPHIRFRSRLPWEDKSSLKELLLDTGYPGAMVIWSKKHFMEAAGSNLVEPYQADNRGIITLATIRIGRLQFQHIPLFVAPKVPRQAHERDGLIGSNILAQFHHVIDFGNRQLLLSTHGAVFRHPVDGTFYPPNNENFEVKDFKTVLIKPSHTLS